MRAAHYQGKGMGMRANQQGMWWKGGERCGLTSVKAVFQRVCRVCARVGAHTSSGCSLEKGRGSYQQILELKQGRPQSERRQAAVCAQPCDEM